MSEQLESILSFRVGSEFFAFDTLKVRHILELSTIAKVPTTKSFVLGIVNLHGNIVPVVDLRMMMAIQNSENTTDTSVVVVSIDGNNDSYIGFVVDQVDEVFSIKGVEIKANVSIDAEHDVVKTFDGNVFAKDRFVHIINLEELSQLVEQ